MSGIKEYTKIEKGSRWLKIDGNACCVTSFHWDGEASHPHYTSVAYL